MTARAQSVGISIGILPQTLIMSRLDQLSRLGPRIYFFIIHKMFSCLWTTLGLKRGAPSKAGPGAVAPLATPKRRLCV
jgi:hypothetical protein